MHTHTHTHAHRHKLGHTRSQEVETDRPYCERNDAWVPHGHAKPATHVTEPPEHNGIWGGRAALGSRGLLYAQVPGVIPCWRLLMTLALRCEYFAVWCVCLCYQNVRVACFWIVFVYLYVSHLAVACFCVQSSRRQPAAMYSEVICDTVCSRAYLSVCLWETCVGVSVWVCRSVGVCVCGRRRERQRECAVMCFARPRVGVVGRCES